jgi:hypothetical protein
MCLDRRETTLEATYLVENFSFCKVNSFWSCKPINHSDRYVERRMGETQEKGKEYNLTMSCKFSIVECLM